MREEKTDDGRKRRDKQKRKLDMKKERIGRKS